MSELTTGEKTGIKAVLADAAPQNSSVPGAVDAVQLPLLPISQVGQGDAERADSVSADRGAGRPLGSKNKSTAAWREYLGVRYTSPLIAMAETYSRSVHDLARELGFTNDKGRTAKPEELLELFKLQLQCAKELAPYMHQKQPMAIEAQGDGLMKLVINTGGATAEQVEQAGTMRVNFVDVETMENQEVSDEKTANSAAPDSATQNNELKTQDKDAKGNGLNVS